MFDRLGGLVVRRPWPVIGAWIGVAAVLGALSPGWGGVTDGHPAGFLPDSYESVRSDALATRAFPEQSGSLALLVVKRREGRVLSAADRAAVQRMVEQLKAAHIKRVVAVWTGPQQRAPDGRVQLVHAALRGPARDDRVGDAVDELRARSDLLLRQTALEAKVTGDAAILNDTRASIQRAEGTTVIATIVLIFVLLASICRSPIAALLAIITIALVFATATSLIALLAGSAGLEVGSEVTSLLIVVLFGVGTNYILFFLFRYRERLRAGADARSAAAFAIGRVGPAIASAALIAMAAFLALMLSRFETFRSLGPALMIAVGVMALAAITLVPAIVGLLRTRVFWPSSNWRHAQPDSASARLGQTIAHRPARVALVSGGALVLLAAGALVFSADYDIAARLPDDSESARAFVELEHGFPAGTPSPTQVFIRGGSRDRRRLHDLAQSLRQIAGVAIVQAPRTSPHGDVALITVMLRARPFSNQALDTVQDAIRPIAHRAAVGGDVLVGGQTSALVDVRKAINRDGRVIYPVAALMIALILGLLLRSLVAALCLLVAVVLGYLATLGTTVSVFQGVAAQPGLGVALPLTVYLLIVAIATGYNILMTARLREEVRAGAAPHRAAGRAVEHTAPTIAAAAVILAATFASLVLTGIGSLVELGFAVAIGAVLTASAMAVLFVPSVAALIGRCSWWPGHHADIESPER
jgi:RND superfamily putative drug exporter